MNYDLYRAGTFTLDCGEVLEDVRLAYKTFGSLNGERTNVVLMPTHFGGTHENSAYLIGAGLALDPDKYFIVIPNLLGNGVSTSPSNAMPASRAHRFPRVSVYDNVRLQYRLLFEELRVRQIALAVGFSMGAIQVFHWAALFPESVKRVAPICGAARISIHNYVFLEGMKAALTADPAWNKGAYTEPPMRGQRAMALAWAAWPPSAHFYRRQLFTRLGYRDVDDFLRRYWEATYGALDANDILCQIHTWQSADISRNHLYDGDFPRALEAITARAVVMPCVNDAYFPPEDSIREVASMPNAQLRPIRSFWGHWAGSGRNPEDTAFIDRNLRELLAS